jgi:TusE/DsrC/DsvC family sulfur relay protein
MKRNIRSRQCNPWERSSSDRLGTRDPLANRTRPSFDPLEWTEEIGRDLSDQDGLALTDRHWKIILFAREYYRKYGTIPLLKVLIKELNKKSSEDEYSVRYVYELFPKSPVTLLCKYAGLPAPSGCT